jgi:hypothetical protein
MIAEAPRNIDALDAKQGKPRVALCDPKISPPRIATDPNATTAATDHLSRIAEVRTNGRYGVKSHPVTVPVTALRTVVGTAIAAMASIMANGPDKGRA